MNTVHDARTAGAPTDDLGRCAHDPSPDRARVTAQRLERLRADSSGHVTLSIDSACRLSSGDVRLLDRVGGPLTSALAGEIGGRITVRIERQGDDVVLEVRSARPGSWTRALRQPAFENLLSELSSSIAKRGTLAITMGSFGRLNAIVRIKAFSPGQD